MKMPLCLTLVDSVYEPKQFQPTPVLSLSPPKHIPQHHIKHREGLCSNR